MSKKSQKALASATILSLVMSTVVYAAPAAPTAGTPISGSSRVDTAIAIAKQSYTKWKDSKVAVIANGDNSHLVDALTVAPLAYQKQAPIFLTLGTGTLEASVIDALKAQGVTTVYVAGGTVTTAVDDQLKAAGVTSVTHLSGLNRWETAKKINAELEKVGAPSAYAVVNTNDSVADALSIAAEAAKQNIEIVLATDKDTADVPAGKTVYAVGGSGVLSDALVSKLGAKRFGGSTRYATNAEVLKGLDAGLDYTTTYVADGTNDHLVDSLPGSVLAGQTGSPIILVSDSVAPEVTDVVKGKAGKITTVVPLGGAVNPTAVQGIVNPDTTPSNSDIKPENIDSIKAVANNKVEVKFKDGVTPDSNAADYKIVVKGSTTALEVKGASLEGQKVVLETAAQTAGTAYTLTVGTASVNFAGIAKNTSTPSIKTVEGKDTNTVKITFDSKMDKEAVETIANYTLNGGASVKSAAISDDRLSVTLTTDGVLNNKLYTITVNNVKNSDGVILKTATKTFIGKTDTTAPTIKNIETTTNNLIVVTFNDVHGVDKTSAETLANYSISDGLAIKSAKAKDTDGDGVYVKVELTTDAQTVGKQYTLTVNNVTDGSVSKNPIKANTTYKFRGKALDKSAPGIDPVVKVLTPTRLEVKFTDNSALDAATATDPNNYVLDGDLTVQKVEMKDTDDPYTDKGRTVVITTSAQDKKGYTLKIKGVGDEYGNTITTQKVLHFTGMDKDNTPPYVTAVKSNGLTKVILTFDGRLDEASAEDPTNYVFDNDLGAALKAEYDEDANTVTLTTADQAVNKTYKITIDNVKDLSGNAMSGAVAKYVATKDESDVTAPTANYAIAYNKDEIRVYFDEPVNVTSNKAINVIDTADNTNTPVTTFLTTEAIDDGNTVVLKRSNGAPLLSADKTYKLDLLSTAVTDKSKNAYVDSSDVTFVGNTETNDTPTVSTVDPADVQTFKVYFSEAVTVATQAATISGENIKLSRDTDDPTLVKITRTDATKKFDKDLTVNFKNYVTDLAGTPAENVDTTLTALAADTDKPLISGVEAVSNNKIVVTYNEGMDTAGSYKVTYKDSKNDKIIHQVVLDGSAVVDSDDNTKVNIFVKNTSGNLLSSDVTYTIVPLTAASDLSGNPCDIKGQSTDFNGSDVIDTTTSILGVEITDGTHINVKKSVDFVGGETVKVYDADDKAEATDLVTGTTTYSDNVATVTLKAPVVYGSNYNVKIMNGATVVASYTFAGIVEDTGISVTQTGNQDAITFNGISSDYDVTVYALDPDGAVTGSAINLTAADYNTGNSTFTLTVGNQQNQLPASVDKVLVVVTKRADGVVKYSTKVDINK